jgi:hypothetical protein
MRRLLSIALIVVVAGCTRGRASEPELLAANVQHLADQRAVTADRWVQTLIERRDGGEPMTASFVSLLVDAAKARAIAKADAAPELGRKLAAYTQYRDFCGEQLDHLERRANGPVPANVTAQLRYAMSDAELRMAQVEPQD